MNLKNKVVVLTGASEGIWEQIALRLAREGVHLALLARNQTRLEEVAEAARAAGAAEVKVYPTDLSETEALSERVTHIASDFGAIDVSQRIWAL